MWGVDCGGHGSFQLDLVVAEVRNNITEIPIDGVDLAGSTMLILTSSSYLALFIVGSWHMFIYVLSGAKLNYQASPILLEVWSLIR